MQATRSFLKSAVDKISSNVLIPSEVNCPRANDYQKLMLHEDFILFVLHGVLRWYR